MGQQPSREVQPREMQSPAPGEEQQLCREGLGAHQADRELVTCPCGPGQQPPGLSWAEQDEEGGSSPQEGHGNKRWSYQGLRAL